ncbi:ELM1/GtrOC1 family putative glycosyltransferase [Candidatus Odyssella thessalonicensis]|uniref:ELM1/GtrOC1 family putative glycosyltransferase n=1 Tax=Candidatus Odyssella thessalonicensis TaxID=84647 RepID=UPI000225AF15|nr:ELM1/GtrOC1 family putative glycosyltransferase [Candidatus Odyssella thessalonicensis]
MKNFFKKFWVFTLLFFPMLAKAAPQVFTLTNPEAVGDHNQILGIQSALKQVVPNTTIFQEFNIKELDKLIMIIKEIHKKHPRDKVVVISVGDYGIDAFKEIKTEINEPFVRCVLSSHQLTDKIASDKEYADLIALPAHAVSPTFVAENPKKLIQTIGVAHNLTKAQIEADYQKYQNQLLPLKNYKKYIGVILGGDAPDASGNIRFYSVAEAQRLARKIAQLAKAENAVVLATDGPRTGKYDPGTQTIIENFHTLATEPNEVSAAFTAVLAAELPADQYKFYSFIFKQPSMSKAIYGAVLHTQGALFVPGESTSMVSESVDNLEKGQVYVYPADSMNENHMAHVKMEQQHGRIKLLDTDFNEIPSASGTSVLNKTAAQVIADEVIKMLL